MKRKFEVTINVLVEGSTEELSNYICNQDDVQEIIQSILVDNFQKTPCGRLNVRLIEGEVTSVTKNYRRFE